MIEIDFTKLGDVAVKHGITDQKVYEIFSDVLKISEYDFGGALSALRHGKKVQRAGWNGKGMWIKRQFPDANSKMTHPYLYIEYPEGHPAYPNGSRVPWFPSQTDMLTEDWSVVE